MSAKNCFRVLFAFVLIFGLFANFKPASASGLYDGFCPNAPARLKPGDIAVVSDKGGPKGLNLRVQPALGQQIIMSIPLYERVTIIAGPKCQDGYRWFEVGYNGQDGWSAEVGSNGIYNLDPNSPPTTQPDQSQGGLQQQSNSWPDNLIGTWENQMACPSNPNNNCDVRVEIARNASGQLQISVYENSVLVGTGVQQNTQGCDGPGSGLCIPEYVFTGNYIVSLTDRGPYLEFYNNNGWLGDLNYSGPPPQISATNPANATPEAITAVDQPNKQVAQASETPGWICYIPIIGLFTCPPVAHARENTFPEGQCTWYVANKRLDVLSWLPESGANANTWAISAQTKGIPTSNAGDPNFKMSDVLPGDIVELTNGDFGSSVRYGHVAYVESVDYQARIIHISEYNGTLPLKYGKRDLPVNNDTNMTFIHKQSSTQTPQQTGGNVCSQYQGLQNLYCKYIPWWKP